MQMKEKNDLFDYGFYIYQNKNYFKFSLDSLLLGEFVDLKDNYRILDMCTGNVPIPLLLMSKNKNLKIVGVELQEQVANLAKESVSVNKLDKSIRIENVNIRDYKTSKKFDVVVCNPPYFKVDETSLINDNEIKRKARHETDITLGEIVTCAKKNLKNKGTFYIVHRTERIVELIKYLDNNGFGITKMCYIYTKENNPAKLVLIKAELSKKSYVKTYYLNISNKKTYKGIFEKEV